MARIITLLVSDDADAAAIMDKPPQGAVLIGLYMAPTKFCQCGNLQSKDGYARNGQFARGSKFGLYIHRVCNLPALNHSHYPSNLLVVGRGLRDIPNMHMSIRYPYDPAKPWRTA